MKVQGIIFVLPQKKPDFTVLGKIFGKLPFAFVTEP
jgi:hypothetical protein